MALKKWFGAALIVSTLGFSGCATPVKKDPNASPTGAAPTTAATTPAPVETAAPTPTESGTPAMGTPTPSGTPSTTSATPSGTPGTVAAGGNAELLADFENADGMKGYEEVKGLTPPPSTPELVAKGKELFATNCANCHGAGGLGDGAAGAALEPKPRNLTIASEYKYGHMDLALYRTGTYGVEGTGMAGWDGIIEADDQWAIGHYIRTLQK